MCVLVHDVERRGAGEEIEIQDSAKHFISEGLTPVGHLHAIAIEEEDTVRKPSLPHVHVERVGAIQVGIVIRGTHVTIKKCIGAAFLEFQAIRSRALPESKKGHRARQLCGDFKVLVFENEWVKEKVFIGAMVGRRG